MTREMDKQQRRANRGEALARCRDMAPIADKAQQEAAQ